MDGRTEEQKIYDTALRSEKRTIGHRMSRKVLVIAPTHQRAQDWAAEHGIAYSDVIYVRPGDWTRQMEARHGIDHIILGWSHFDPETRSFIKDMLVRIESAPFEGEPVDAGLCGADPVWP